MKDKVHTVELYLLEEGNMDDAYCLVLDELGKFVRLEDGVVKLFIPPEAGPNIARTPAEHYGLKVALPVPKVIN